MLRADPADAQAHLVLIRASADRGDIRGALRQFERMDQALHRELGTAPSAEAQRLRRRLESRAPATVDQQRTRLFGRRDGGDQIRKRLERAEAGRGGTVVFTGPPGVGKSAVLDLDEAIAKRRGWQTGRGYGSAVEGPWPDAAVDRTAVEVLCRACRGAGDAARPAGCDVRDAR